MQHKTAFQVANENSKFLLSLADCLECLPLDQRIIIRKRIIEHNENNLKVMDQEVKAKMRRVA